MYSLWFALDPGVTFGSLDLIAYGPTDIPGPCEVDTSAFLSFLHTFSLTNVRS